MKKVVLFLFIFISSAKSFAGRPLYTDDSGVIGNSDLQLETWIISDKRSLQHWIVPTFGIGDRLEISASGVHGLSFIQENQNVYSISGPIFQAKGLLLPALENGKPGLALAAGTLPPFGRGAFKSPAWEYYYYFATSSYVLGSDKFLVHLNLGNQTQRQLYKKSTALLWGLALELKTGSNTHTFVESTNGEIYGLFPGEIIQTGIRHDLQSHLQIDGSIGKGISGNPILPFWITLGLKVVI